ncbi:MAG: hypothetical protein IJR28_06040 [Ottowia sp.]|nr:hypothetical protein [Ottowia sp.]
MDTARQAVQDGYLEYYGRLCVSQICPDLDIAWRARLEKIFSTMPLEWCEGIYKELLAPANVLWSFKDNTHTFGRRAGKIGLKEFVEAECPMPLQGLASKCLASVQALEQMNSVVDIARLLENTLDGFQDGVQGMEADMLPARRTLMEKYIRTAGAAIKLKKELMPPPSQRGLDADVARTFITEIFLKQKLLGPRFLLLRRRQLERLNQPFFRDFLSQQQGVRRLEIVHTTRYIFALATPADARENAFSAQRFFSEETISAQMPAGSASYSCCFIRENRTDDIKRVAVFKEQIENTISLSSQVSQGVRDALEHMEEHYDLRMRSILFSTLVVPSVPLKNVIAHRLGQYKSMLESGILQPLKKCIVLECVHPMDFAYLFTGVRQLLAEIIADFAGFQSQSLVRGDTGAERMQARLQAYAQLLVKRRERIFSSEAVQRWQENSDAAAGPRKGLRDIIKKYGKQSLKLKKQAGHGEQEQTRESDSLFGRLLGLGKAEDEGSGLSDAQLEIKKIRRAAHLEIINLFTQWRDEILVLDREPLRFLKRQRCYAVCAGSNGLDKLPVLAVFPENYNDFDPGAYLKMFMDKRRPSRSDARDDDPSAQSAFVVTAPSEP